MIIPFTANDGLVDDYHHQMREKSLIPHYVSLRSYADKRISEIRQKLKEVKPARYRTQETKAYHKLLIYFIQQRSKANCHIMDFRMTVDDDFLAYKEDIKKFIEKHSLQYTVHQLLRTSSIKKNVKPEDYRYFSVFVDQVKNINSCTIV